MVVKTINLQAPIKKKICLSLLLVMLAVSSAFAGNYSDTTKKKLLASLGRKKVAVYTVQEANVVFPDILKGNEEEAIPYITNFSTNKRDYLVRMYTKGKDYLPKAAAILQKYHLPTELKVLLVLESAYNANAVSKAGAVGYWQIMDEVAKEYGMNYVAHLSPAERKRLLKAAAKKWHKKTRVTRKKDDRKNFNIATVTAARYLSDRRRNLNDNWLLVVASYNCGIGNVWNAMERSGKTNPDFWDIKQYLPAETRAYVMNFIALNVIFHNYEKFAKNTLSFTPVKIKITDDPEKDIPADMEDHPPVYHD